MPTLKKSKSEGADKVRERVLFAMKRIMMSNRAVRTRKAWGERIHTDPSRINSWENMNGHPTVENLVDMCKEFSISPDWLLLGKGEMFGSAEIIKRIEDLETRVADVEMHMNLRKK
jgi:hypothetical protein